MAWVLGVVGGLVLVAVIVLLTYVPRPAGWPWWARALAVAAGLAVLAGAVLAVWKVPTLLYGYITDTKERANAEASTRTGLIAGLAGLAALGSLLVTSRTYRVTEQGHITDRYTKAISQLGDDKLDVRLGGIYALERLATDSKRDHPTVVEVLGAFVRVRRPAGALRRKEADRKTAHPPLLTARREAVLRTPDVQAALTVLGRLPVRRGVRRGDLFEADLTWAHFRGANLAGAYLIRVDLTDAFLGWANFAGAYLLSADLTNADLRGADLTNADLRRADLANANLAGADLAGARNLTAEQIASARGDAETTLPEHISRPEHWDRRSPESPDGVS